MHDGGERHVGIASQHRMQGGGAMRGQILGEGDPTE
jgi:hypothetical protein